MDQVSFVGGSYSIPCRFHPPIALTYFSCVCKIKPRVREIRGSDFEAATLGVSESYAAGIRAGRHCPHPRHWQALAELVSTLPWITPPTMIRKQNIKYCEESQSGFVIYT